MTRTAAKRTASALPKKTGAAKKAAGSAVAKKSQGAQQPKPQPRGRKIAGAAGRSRLPAAPAPPESTADALERAIRELDIEVTAKRAVIVATARRLAEALDGALPTDRAKLSKELRSVWAELVAEANPSVDDDDWTAQAGLAQVRNIKEPGSANPRARGRRGGVAAGASDDAVAAPRRRRRA